MKRPPSVTAAIVVLAIILFVSLLTFTSLRREHLTLSVFLVAPVMPLLHATPLYGLLRRRSWSRPFSVAVLSLWATGFLAIAIWETFWRGQPVQMIPGLLGTGLLIWLVASLLLNPDVPVYLAGRATPVIEVSGSSSTVS